MYCCGGGALKLAKCSNLPVPPAPSQTAPLKALSSSQRPPSKPRVRNPLTSLKPSAAAHHSPSLIEKEFLESVGGAEEDYYSTFPEDVVPLNDSLTSSMVSMYKDLDTPKVGGLGRRKVLGNFGIDLHLWSGCC